MFKNVIWATDGSEHADRALATALAIVEEGHGKLVAVHANEIMGGRGGGFSVFADEEELRDHIQAQVNDLVAAGVDAEFRVATGVQRDPGDLIADEARKLRADVIVVGTRGHGRIAGMLLGSVTQRLLHVAPCPVLAVPTGARVEAEQATA
jgi:nucleotide-binding universal stress UspA family protein